MEHHLDRDFLPAAGRHGHLALYDPFVKLLGFDRVRRVLLEQAAIEPKQRVLDVGCGTGTLVTLIKRLHPEAEVVGLDPDAKILERARRKATRAGVQVLFDQGFADRMPYPDASFDRVVSSFMFHHVPPGQQQNMFREVRRVLAPGGSLHLLDFAGPSSRDSWLERILHRAEHMAHNGEERVVGLMRDGGLADARVINEQRVLAGSIRVVYYRAA
jgi:ubiquinone/menaquinone biosynthesis C-methylase UbiE